ncbi:MAG TPA: hypothetical protein VFR08_08435, partial [Candidatus Angelobacter sp.]|nr:hypothetical protein [Candidatus Angelobacter sp.]
MPKQIDPAMKNALTARVNYYREMGIYDFYRRPVEEGVEPALLTAVSPELQEPIPENNSPMPKATKPSSSSLSVPVLLSSQDKVAALSAIREHIGDCT